MNRLMTLLRRLFPVFAHEERVALVRWTITRPVAHR
jgi:hypothetical protein